MNVLALPILSFAASLSCSIIEAELKGPSVSKGSFYIALGNTCIILASKVVLLVDRINTVLVKKVKSSTWKKHGTAAVDYKPCNMEALIIDNVEFDNSMLDFDAMELTSLIDQSGGNFAHATFSPFNTPPEGQFWKSFMKVLGNQELFVPPNFPDALLQQAGDICGHADHRSISFYKLFSPVTVVDPAWYYGLCRFSPAVFEENFVFYGSIQHCESPLIPGDILVHMYGKVSLFAVSKNGLVRMEQNKAGSYQCIPFRSSDVAMIVIYQESIPHTVRNYADLMRLISARRHVGIIN